MNEVNYYEQLKALKLTSFDIYVYNSYCPNILHKNQFEWDTMEAHGKKNYLDVLVKKAINLDIVIMFYISGYKYEAVGNLFFIINNKGEIIKHPQIVENLSDFGVSTAKELAEKELYIFDHKHPSSIRKWEGYINYKDPDLSSLHTLNEYIVNDSPTKIVPDEFYVGDNSWYTNEEIEYDMKMYVKVVNVTFYNPRSYTSDTRYYTIPDNVKTVCGQVVTIPYARSKINGIIVSKPIKTSRYLLENYTVSNIWEIDFSLERHQNKDEALKPIHITKDGIELKVVEVAVNNNKTVLYGTDFEISKGAELIVPYTNSIITAVAVRDSYTINSNKLGFDLSKLKKVISSM